MRPAWLGLVPALWLATMAWALDEPTGKPPPGVSAETPSDQYRALLKAYQSAIEEFSKAYRDAKTDAERQDVFKAKYPQPKAFASRFLELAEAHPDDPAALDALIWVAGNATFEPDGTRAIEGLARDHARSEKLAPVVQRLAQLGAPAAQPLFRAAADQSDNHEVKAWSLYGLARVLKRGAETGQAADAAKSTAEAEQGFREIVAKYDDVKTPRGTLGDLARGDLEEILRLGVGRPAPEITGEDIDGRRLELSNYQGKVVLLEFWGNWNDACRDRYPHDRELVKKLADKPFVLLGVNSDEDRGALKARIAEERIHWRSWWDGGSKSGPIARLWHVQGWPTFFLIDQKGLIRNKFLGYPGDETFRKALEALLKEAEKAGG
jgi:peroxiredoxin